MLTAADFLIGAAIGFAHASAMASRELTDRIFCEMQRDVLRWNIPNSLASGRMKGVPANGDFSSLGRTRPWGVVERAAVHAVVSSSFHGSGEARARASAGSSGGRPRWLRILRTALRSMTHASSCTLPPHVVVGVKSSWSFSHPSYSRTPSSHI